MTEDWTSPASGALREEPLLLRANRAGAFGTSEMYEGGGVHKALFTYLCGEPNVGLFNARPDLFFGSWLVCVSAAWESFIREKPCERVMRRVMMKPRRVHQGAIAAAARLRAQPFHAGEFRGPSV